MDSTDNTAEISVFTILECFLLSSILTLIITSGAYEYGSFGTVDFIEYWSAGQLWLQGANPYDFNAMAQLQNDVGLQDENAIMMWNPPWTLVFMAPLLFLNFLDAAKLWIAINLVLIYCSALMLCKALDYKFKNGLIIPFATLLFFYPILSCLKWGQIGIFLMFGISALLYSLRYQQFFRAGLCLCILSLKPHLFLILALALGLEVILRKRYLIILGFLTGISVLALTSYAVSPIGVHTWVASLFPSTSSGHGIEVTSWKVATLPGIIRIFCENNQLAQSRELSWLATLLGTLFYFGYRIKNSSEPRWEIHLIPILCLSFFIAPHGWPYDFSSLALGQLVVLILALKSKVLTPSLVSKMGSLFAVSLACLLLLNFGIKSQHQYFLFPVIFLIVYLAVIKNIEIHLSPKFASNDKFL